MVPQLIQIKVNPGLKKDIQEIAFYKGIPVTSFIKLTLTEVVRREKKEMLTENGLTEREELEILQREKHFIKANKKGKLRPLSAKELVKALNS